MDAESASRAWARRDWEWHSGSAAVCVRQWAWWVCTRICCLLVVQKCFLRKTKADSRAFRARDPGSLMNWLSGSRL